MQLTGNLWQVTIFVLVFEIHIYCRHKICLLLDWKIEKNALGKQKDRGHLLSLGLQLIALIFLCNHLFFGKTKPK